MLKSEEIHIRDPFVLVHEGRYYLYGSDGECCWGEANGFSVYVGCDLENWEGPFEVFHNDGTFWADRHYWAPEVHPYRGSFYMFASFKRDGVRRGTQILSAGSPLGPFRPISEGPVTPADWECLDGTLYVALDGTPYIVFCHEWVQIRDGTICAMQLTEDLRAPAGEPQVLFRASEAGNWVTDIDRTDPQAPPAFVTDGPYLYRCQNGELLMIWSSFGTDGYVQAVARSDNGEITGHWTQDREPLFRRDGGHGMLFRTLEGELCLTLHAPNVPPRERPVFYRIRETDGRLLLGERRTRARQTEDVDS